MNTASGFGDQKFSDKSSGAASSFYTSRTLFNQFIVEPWHKLQDKFSSQWGDVKALFDTFHPLYKSAGFALIFVAMLPAIHFGLWMYLSPAAQLIVQNLFELVSKNVFLSHDLWTGVLFKTLSSFVLFELAQQLLHSTVTFLQRILLGLLEDKLLAYWQTKLFDTELSKTLSFSCSNRSVVPLRAYAQKLVTYLQQVTTWIIYGICLGGPFIFSLFFTQATVFGALPWLYCAGFAVGKLLLDILVLQLERLENTLRVRLDELNQAEARYSVDAYESLPQLLEEHDHGKMQAALAEIRQESARLRWKVYALHYVTNIFKQIIALCVRVMPFIWMALEPSMPMKTVVYTAWQQFMMLLNVLQFSPNVRFMQIIDSIRSLFNSCSCETEEKPVLKLQIGETVQLEAGKVYLVEGSNGTGKSTLLSAFNRFKNFSFAQTGIAHQTISGSAEAWAQILPAGQKTLTLSKTYSFNYPLPSSFKPAIDSALTYAMPHFPVASDAQKAALKQRIEEFLTALRFAHLISRLEQPLEGCSNGEKRILEIIRAVLFEPQLLIIDEAFSALDQEKLSIVQQFLLDKLPKTTILWVDHAQSKLDSNNAETDARPMRHVRVELEKNDGQASELQLPFFSPQHYGGSVKFTVMSEQEATNGQAVACVQQFAVKRKCAR